MIKQAYINGFMCKCAEHGIPEGTAVHMLKTAYELGSVSPPDLGGLPGMPPPDWKSFAKEDPLTRYPRNGVAEAWMPNWFADNILRGVVDANLPKPKSTKEQIKDYKAIADHFEDGLIRRLPIVEDGQYNSTSVKDFNDLANLQSDAIRRRRGVGRNLIWNPKIQRYRVQDEDRL